MIDEVASLYACVLGEDFAALPVALRKFHGRREGGTARGELRVRRGRGPLARLAAWVIRAPPAGERVAIELRIELDERGRERWIRRFGRREMVTHQWRRGPWLIEGVSLTELRFALHADASGMSFEQRGCRCLGLPLPAALAPKISVRVGSGPEHAGIGAWEIDVRVVLPVIGMVVEYAGTMIPVP